MKIPRDLYDEMIDHARADVPNECCGLIALRDGVATELRRATNAQASPYRFEIEGSDLLWTVELENRGLDLAIYHSHVRTAPEPSQTDITYAREWPHALWVIVGLSEAEPVVRAWWIRDGRVSEEALQVQ